MLPAHDLARLSDGKAVNVAYLAVTAYGAQPSYAERDRIEAHAALLQLQRRPRSGG